MSRNAGERAGLFRILLGASVLSSLASVPYVQEIVSQFPRMAGPDVAMRGPYPYLFSALQAVLFTVPTAWIGLRLAPRVGLRILPASWGSALQHGFGVGLGVGVLLVVLSSLLPIPFPEITIRHPAWWKALLASASAGINEEIWFRLGVMTALVAAGMALLRIPMASAGARREWVEGEEPVVPAMGMSDLAVAGDHEAAVSRTPSWIFWTAGACASLLFGAMHLPQAAAITSLTPAVVAYTLLGNGIAGTVFGLLYWKRGLVAAMVAHFATDIVLHVIAPLAGA